MGKIVSDLSGDLRKGVFYRFEVMYEDIPYDDPTPEWIIVPRTPTNDALIDADQPYYVHLEDYPSKEDEVELRDCPANTSHVTLSYYRTLRANLAGDVRIAPFIPTSPRCLSAVSEDLYGRLHSLNMKGARLDPVKFGSEPHKLKEKNVKLWHLQFVGRTRMRPPKVVDAPNLCPYCGQGRIICESCGYRASLCENCGQEMRVIEYKHKGSGDKRIPFDSHLATVIEGKSWDGSELVQGCYASKRFIDWLLRIHAAPFYAEPVWFCVDGMSDQQKKWFDDLQKPFEV